MAPKKGYLAPYVQFPWNYDDTLIGQPISVYKVNGGFFLALENKQFTWSDDTNTKNLMPIKECKLTEIKNKSQN